MRTPRSAAATLAAGITFVTVLVGCGSGSGKPAVCSDMESLQKSVQSLGDVSIEAGALTKIHDDLTTISDQFETFKTNAKSQFSGDVSKVQTAIDELSAAVGTATHSPSASSIAAAGTAAKGVVDATKSLATSVSGTC